MRPRLFILVLMLSLGIGLPAFAADAQDPDVQRLAAQLDQLSADPVLGGFAGGEQARARDAVAQLREAGRRQRAHALFIAEQRVALARIAAQTGEDQARLDQLARDHDRILLEASRADADAARAELERQRMQYQAAVEEAQRLQQQGAEYSQQAQQAQQEADQANKLAAAQARAAALARKEATLAEAATRALRGGDSGAGASAGLNLSNGAFRAGAAELSASRVRKLAEFAKAHAGQTIRIQPHAASGMRVLAGRRAVAVRDALVAGGADAGRISIQPVASGSRGATVEVSAH